MEFYSKLKWFLGIGIVFFLIISTNLLDRNNFEKVRDSVVAIYEDRLVANDIIFEVTNCLNKKAIAIALSDSIYYEKGSATENIKLGELMVRFENTKLTKVESEVFDKLKSSIEILHQREIEFINTDRKDNLAVVKQLEITKSNVAQLSGIQLSEGKQQLGISNRALDTIELFTKIEIYLLIFLAVLVQVIVMYSPTKKEETD